MSRRHQEHQARLAAVNALGRTLVRRSGGACELCATSGVPLRPVEIEPLTEEPEVDETLFACDSCKAAVGGGRLDDGALRFLEGTAWSDVRPVQVASVRLLRRLSRAQTTWANDVLAGLYLDPEIEARVDAGE